MSLDPVDRPAPEPRPEDTATPVPKSGSVVGLLGMAVAAGLVAGLAAWGLSEATHRAFRPEVKVVETMAGRLEVPEPESKRRTDAANAALVYGGLGALLGLGLGAVGGRAAGSTRSAVRGAMVGLVVGGAAPSVLAAAVVPRQFDYRRGLDPTRADPIMPLLFHSALWAGVGLAGGLAMGAGLGGPAKVANGLIGGLVGAVIGAGAYEVIAAVAMPRADSSAPLPEDRWVRLVACLAVALAVSMLSAAAVSSGSRAKPAKAGAVS